MATRSKQKALERQAKADTRPRATAKFIRISPFKVRIVLDVIKGKPVTEAIAILENTPKAANELEAISSYSATRIENMRALLMYAKLQSARLQYMAARALLDAEMEKTPNGNYLEFNLDKYILTKEYVDDLIKKAGTVNEAVTATESFEVNAEEYQWLEGGDTND